MIKDVRSTMVSVPLKRPVRFATRVVRKRDFTVVEVETDTGIVGAGVVPWHHTAIAVDRNLKPLLVGQDPFAHEKLWDVMYRELYRERKGAAMNAISAVDMAIWDIIGKELRIPLYKLLGGFREKVPCYASGGYYGEGKGLSELAREMGGFMEQGFRAVKMKIGLLPPRKDYERIKAAREAIGDDAELMIDANNAYNSHTAIQAGRLFEKLNITWFEEPVMPDDLEGSAKVAAALDVPVAAGELEYTRYGFRDMIEKRAADILQPDAVLCGGISETVKIANTAAAWNIPISPHAVHDVHVHIVAGLSNGLTVEYFDPAADIMKETELFEETLQPKAGFLEPPNKPGLGIELNHSALEKYKI